MNFCGKSGAFVQHLHLAHKRMRPALFEVPVFMLMGMFVTGCLFWLKVDAGMLLVSENKSQPAIQIEGDFDVFRARRSIRSVV